MNRKKIIIIFCLFFLLAILGGMLGEIITSAYIFQSNFNLPIFGEINYSKNLNDGSSLIIREARKVVVEQDERILQTANSVGNSIVSIYKKDSVESINFISSLTNQATSAKILNLRKTPAGTGIIVTSDGWIMSVFRPQINENLSKNADLASLQRKELIDNYYLVSKDKKIYKISQAIFDNHSQITFLKIAAADLSVIKFSLQNPAKPGETLVAVNNQGMPWPTTVSNVTNRLTGMVLPSDKHANQLILNQVPANQFIGSFTFNLNNELNGIILAQNNIEPIENFAPAINSLLKFKAIRYPSLGVNFVNLDDNIILENNIIDEKGALIYKSKDGVAVNKNSSAQKAGIKEGDIIVSLNNIEINRTNPLNYLIYQYLPGDEINLSIRSNNKLSDIKVELGELK